MVNMPDTSQSMLDRYFETSDPSSFDRETDGEYEPVQYFYGSSVRIWYNEQTADYDTHWHSAVEIVLPIDNSYTVIADKVEYVLNPGEIFFIPPGVLHYLKAPDSGTRLIYLIDADILYMLPGMDNLQLFISKPTLISPAVCGDIYEQEINILSDIWRDYCLGEDFWELNICMRTIGFLMLLGKSLQPITDIHTSKNPAGRRQLTDRISVVIDYIDNHFDEDINLETAAEIAGFSKYHFSRIFKEYSGQNFNDYLRSRRIQGAARMLADTDRTAMDIALSCGFSSVSTFNRTFKALRGCTPIEYRKLVHDDVTA